MPALDPNDLQAVWLTFKLASVATLLLLLIATPLAWWLAHSGKWYRGSRFGTGGVAAGVAAHGAGFLFAGIDGATRAGGCADQGFASRHLAVHLRRAGGRLGVVFAAVRGAAYPERIRSDRQTPAGSGGDLACRCVGSFLQRGVAAGAPGLLTAIILAFAHTVGEFGVVLMLGGNIPGRDAGAVGRRSTTMSRRWSTAQAHWLAGGMVLFSFIVLLVLYLAGGKLSRVMQ